ncbi:MAG: hypothetical protein Fues2KO_14230 [Fuerstiella sp.]
MAEQDVALTPFQTKLLTQYQSFYQSAPSVGSLVALSVRSHILMIVISAAASFLCFSIGIAPVGFVVIGMLVGAISRDVGQFRKITRAWPVLRRIIDWSLLNSLLCGDSLERDA